MPITEILINAPPGCLYNCPRLRKKARRCCRNHWLTCLPSAGPGLFLSDCLFIPPQLSRVRYQDTILQYENFFVHFINRGEIMSCNQHGNAHLVE